MNYLEQIRHWFETQEKPQKIRLMGGLAVIVALTISLSVWVLSPTYSVLFNHLDSQDANQIMTQLEQDNIVYQLKNDGRDILIDKQLIDKTRIKLMGSGLQLSHSIGFELFDKTDFGMTDFSQKINYQRALQGELERTINSLEEVKQSRVHLVIPQSHLFQNENNLPRAAVTLHLKKTLTSKQVISIQQLVTASVANLSASNVVIVDQFGNGLMANDDDSSATHFTAKKSIERYLNQKVMQMLMEVFHQNQVMVKIDATLNYDELKRELIKPQTGGTVIHEKETQHSSTNKSDKKSGNHDFTREKSYQFGHEKENFTRANGTIQRLTISVVLPQTTKKEKIAQIERVVKSTIGFDSKRGDTMSVEALIAEKKSETKRYEPTRSQTSYASYLGLIIFVLLLIGGCLHIQLRKKHRQRLLMELNQWLLEHE